MAAMVCAQAYRQVLTDSFPLTILGMKGLKTVGGVICDC
jgi:hypothetical protein